MNAEPSNEARAERVRRVIEFYCEKLLGSELCEQDREDYIVDLLADIRHYFDIYPGNMAAVQQRALQTYLDEECE